MVTYVSYKDKEINEIIYWEETTLIKANGSLSKNFY